MDDDWGGFTSSRCWIPKVSCFCLFLAFKMPVSTFCWARMLDHTSRKLFTYLIVYLFDYKAYHSSLQAPNSIGNMALLPINTKFKGPAPPGGTAQTPFFVICLRNNYFIVKSPNGLRSLNRWSIDELGIVISDLYVIKIDKLTLTVSFMVFRWK